MCRTLCLEICRTKGDDVCFFAYINRTVTRDHFCKCLPIDVEHIILGWVSSMQMDEFEIRELRSHPTLSNPFPNRCRHKISVHFRIDGILFVVRRDYMFLLGYNVCDHFVSRISKLRLQFLFSFLHLRF